jgi:hypothetical protein
MVAVLESVNTSTQRRRRDGLTGGHFEVLHGTQVTSTNSRTKSYSFRNRHLQEFARKRGRYPWHHNVTTVRYTTVYAVVR